MRTTALICRSLWSCPSARRVSPSRYSGGAEIFHALKAVLKAKGYATAVGDEGGYAPNLKSNQEALDVMMEAITKAGLTPGKEIMFAMDPASTELWEAAKEKGEEGKYYFWKSDMMKSREEMVEFWVIWSITTRLSRSKTVWPKRIGTVGPC